MDISITTLTANDIGDVDQLMRSNTATLGFLPRAALKDYLSKGNVIGALLEDYGLVGYLLYGVTQRYFRITHLCILDSLRERGIARGLVEELKSRATSQYLITLNCRRDFPANQIWPKLRFIPRGEKPARSGSGRVLTQWCLTLGSNDQPSLFEAHSAATTIDVAIDAQIFFDMVSDATDRPTESLALSSDFMADLVNLRITDELLVEIDRNSDTVLRKSHREQASNFFQVRHDANLADSHEVRLRTILPTDSKRALSDVRHLAKTAGAGIKYFVTRDKHLLNKRDAIAELAALQVLSPTELIVQVHELSDSAEYEPKGVLGLTLQRRRMRSSDLSALKFEAFLAGHEWKGELEGKLNYYLAEPINNTCEIFESAGEIVAIRVIEYFDQTTIRINLARAKSGKNRPLVETHLVADSIRGAVASKFSVVKFRDSSTFRRLRSALLEMGFICFNEEFIRFSVCGIRPLKAILSEILKSHPNEFPYYSRMTERDIERKCSPLAIPAITNYFLIPIRPGFAISLVDWEQSADELFGGQQSVLLRWDHVYYRSNTHHKMLRPPGRILWYVSSNSSRKRKTRLQGKVVAISHLDSVELGYPKQIFQKHRRKGIFEWDQIMELCRGDLNRKIMGIEFSHTFPFKRPITLNDLRKIYGEQGMNLVLQSPSRIPQTIFEEIYRFGFEV